MYHHEHGEEFVWVVVLCRWAANVVVNEVDAIQVVGEYLYVRGGCFGCWLGLAIAYSLARMIFSKSGSLSTIWILLINLPFPLGGMKETSTYILCKGLYLGRVFCLWKVRGDGVNGEFDHFVCGYGSGWVMSGNY